ncbi:MAG: hypothetical protein LBT92_02190 [Rickettsiales bacterium]|jgi:hypothetical protein|nr:hypothetical protein [Rickettsiales bacterium]
MKIQSPYRQEFDAVAARPAMELFFAPYLSPKPPRKSKEKPDRISELEHTMFDTLGGIMVEQQLVDATVNERMFTMLFARKHFKDVDEFARYRLDAAKAGWNIQSAMALVEGCQRAIYNDVCVMFKILDDSKHIKSATLKTNMILSSMQGAGDFEKMVFTRKPSRMLLRAALAFAIVDDFSSILLRYERGAGRMNVNLVACSDELYNASPEGCALADERVAEWTETIDGIISFIQGDDGKYDWREIPSFARKGAKKAEAERIAKLRSMLGPER